MASFLLTISSPGEKLFEGTVTYCGIVTLDGEMGIKAHHEPLVAALKDDSKLMYRTADGQEHSLNVKNAMLSFDKNSCLVLCS